MQLYSKCVCTRRWIVNPAYGVISLLLAGGAAQGQWVSTATKAMGPVLASATTLGAVAGSTPLQIRVGLNMRNASQVQPMLKRMITPGDPMFGQQLTVAQFVQQFGPTTAQVQAVENYLSSNGFSNLTVTPNNLMIEATGTVAQAEAAFNTKLVAYSLNGQQIFANSEDAQVPTSLSGTVAAVLGLNNIVAMTTQTKPRTTTDPCGPANTTNPVCPTPDTSNLTYTPQQYQIAYDALCASDGMRQGGVACKANKELITPACNTPIGSIADGDVGCLNKSKNCPVSTSSSTNELVVAGTPSANSTGVLKDLYEYWTNYKLPVDPVTVVYTGIPTPDTSGAEEWDLDSQTATGIAQQVKEYYFYVASSLTDSDLALTFTRYASDNKAKLMSISLGECEVFPYVDGAMVTDDMAFAEAALQGQTTFASSDDNGSACPLLPTNGIPGSGPPFVSYPASSPYIIAVGSTDLFTNTDYTYDLELGAEFSGGGTSLVETSPFWQNSVAPAAYADSDRSVPDVSMCGEPNFCGAILYTGADPATGAGSTQTCCTGGTSLSSPLAMGAFGRIQTAHSNKFGYAGPLIYQLSTGTVPGPGQTIVGFNDVTAGSNGVYEATVGWDSVTGLGTWDILALDSLIPLTYPH